LAAEIICEPPSADLLSGSKDGLGPHFYDGYQGEHKFVAGKNIASKGSPTLTPGMMRNAIGGESTPSGHHKGGKPSF
jgi:hypothetical protein